MYNMVTSELRTLEYVLTDKRNRRVITTPEVKTNDSAIKNTTGHLYTSQFRIPVRIRLLGIIGLHDFLKKFIDMMELGEIFSALESVTVSTEETQKK